MFVEEIKVTRKGKTYKSVLIRETFRVGKMVHHHTLANISKLPDEHINRIKRIINKKSLDDYPAETSDNQAVQILSSREYGASCSVLQILKKLRLDTIISSRKSEFRDNVLAMICGRIVFQGSKLSLVNRYRDTVLWELCGHPADQRPDVNRHCYFALDQLLKQQARIQKKLADEHLSEGCLVLYDLSSSYLTGEYEDSDLAEFGYSRDRKRGLQQINFGLLTTAEGCPVSVEVFSGNTCDQTTVAAQTQRITKKFGVKTVIFVGDRGMLTPKRVKEVNAQGFYTITALTHAQMRDLLNRQIIRRRQFNNKTVTSVSDPENSKVRYVLCFNPPRRFNDKITRQRLIEKTELALECVRNRKRKTDVKSICAAVGKVWKGCKTEKYFNWTVSENGKLEYSRKEEIINAEERLDGCYVIRTDVPESKLTAPEVLDSYRKLSYVEQAFRYIKTASLDLRPIHHHIDDRIRAHVFLCMLAYYVEWHILKALQPILSQDEKGKHRRWTLKQVLERLKAIRSHTCAVDGVIIRDLKSKPDDEQQSLLNCLEVDL